MSKPLNITTDEKVIADMDKVIQKSNGKYRNRSHFAELAIQEKIKKENAE